MHQPDGKLLDFPDHPTRARMQWHGLIGFTTDRLRPAAVDRHGVTDDVFVEGAQQGIGKMLALGRPLGEQAVILGDIFRVPFLGVRMVELLIAEAVNILRLQQGEDPLLENQLLIEFELGRGQL